MRVLRKKNLKNRNACIRSSLWLVSGLWFLPFCYPDEVLDTNQVSFKEVAWYPSYEGEGFQSWLSPQETTKLTDVGIKSIEFDPEHVGVTLQIESNSTRLYRGELWYADQKREEDDFSSLKWQLLSENIEIEPGQLIRLTDTGEITGVPPQYVFRRFYVLRPIGVEILPLVVENSPEVQNEMSTLELLENFEEPSTSMHPINSEQIDSESQAFTMEDAERLVAEEYALQVESDRQNTRHLMSKPARRAWQLERNGMLLVARELNEAPVTTSQVAVPTSGIFSTGDGSTNEQRVEMVVAHIHPDGLTQVTGRNMNGGEVEWTTNRDFRLLEGVRVFSRNDIQWTVFVLPSPSPSGEGIRQNSDGPAPEGVLSALSSYYDTHWEQLKEERARKELIREARETLRANRVPT
ncbi:MAG: hypothetical protein PF795_14230, partial [Kiritimatiellae bacterium]|nr:hypothetical protein [Kiritimatiellia bacterium]